MAKIDLVDGYYRDPLLPEAVLALAVVIPSDDVYNSSNLVMIPLSLPMGWTHSPPYFCAYMETITDMTNNTTFVPPTHPLLTETQCIPSPQQETFHERAVILGANNTPPLEYTDVYIDDFMVITQRPHHMLTLNRLLTNVDAIFANPKPKNWRQIVSTSKLQKGKASFSTRKRL
jgi:hypothetical protein